MRKVVSTSNVLMGAPRIKNTRISVYDVVSSLWHDNDINQYIDDFQIERKEIENVLIYCKSLKCKKSKVHKFCNGCILNINEKENPSIYHKIDENLFANEKDFFFIAESINDIEEEDVGFAGWKRAEKLYEDFFPQAGPSIR